MRAALYLRVSTAEQADRYSLPAQRRVLIEFCEHQGWDYLVYEDAGISGETIDARPAMKQLLQDAVARKFEVVLAVEMERFSRSRDGIDLAFIKRVFREAGVRFGTPAQLFNPDDVEDDFVSGLLGLLASREKTKIVERTKRGRLEAARSGRYVSGQVPYGYRKSTDGGLAIHEPEAQTVRLIFDLLARGRSIGEVVRELLTRKLTSPRGGLWTRGTIQRILRNPVYGGTAAYGRQKVERRGQRRQLRRREPAEWILVLVPRIVAPDVSGQVEARLQQNVILSRRNQKRFYLLRGLVRCGVCGHTMTGKFCGGYRYHTCQASRDRGPTPRCRWHAISANALEDLVWEQVTALLRKPDLILAEARRYRERRVSEHDESLMRLSYVRKALQDLPRERERVQTLYREGYANLEDTKRHISAIEDKRAKLEEERRIWEVRAAESAVGEDQGARLEQVIAKVARRLERLTDVERFEVVHSLIERVVIGQDQGVEIHAYVPRETPIKQGSAFVRTAWQDLSIASMTS